MSAYGNPIDDHCLYCGSYAHDSIYCSAKGNLIPIPSEAEAMALVLSHEGRIESLEKSLLFIAETPNLQFVKPTELRPTWRLVQFDGPASRILGEEKDLYTCVLEARRAV